MYYLYDGKEFKHATAVNAMVKVDHALLKAYNPKVDVSELEHLGITEHMTLSYLYVHKLNFSEVPLKYPL